MARPKSQINVDMGEESSHAWEWECTQGVRVQTGRGPVLQGIRLLKFISRQSPLSNLRYDNGRQDVNAACQHVLHPGEPRRKHWLDLERPQADSVIKSAINKSWQSWGSTEGWRTGWKETLATGYREKAFTFLFPLLTHYNKQTNKISGTFMWVTLCYHTGQERLCV